jgi:general secretion pathway protein A
MLAFQSLSMLYDIHIDTQSIDAPCHQAESQGMRCYSGYGGLSDLFQLDQPVVMHLRSESGKEYWATLISSDHQTANLKVAGVEQNIQLNELASAWFGHYIAILNSPPDYNGRITLRYRGPSVTWLRHTMESIDGIRDNGSNEFDEELAQRVRLFQLSDGIQPDGLVGPLTLIRLNVRSGKAKQHLVTDQRG